MAGLQDLAKIGERGGTGLCPHGGLQVMRLEAAIAAYEGNYLGKVSKETYESLLKARESIQSRVEKK